MCRDYMMTRRQMLLKMRDYLNILKDDKKFMHTVQLGTVGMGSYED